MSSEHDLVRLVVAIVAIVLLLPLFLIAFTVPFVGMWTGRHMGDGATVPGIWLLMWVLSLAILIVAGYLLYRLFSSSGRTSDPAFDELRRAYARGELTDEEFEQRRERLRDQQ